MLYKKLVPLVFCLVLWPFIDLRANFQKLEYLSAETFVTPEDVLTADFAPIAFSEVEKKGPNIHQLSETQFLLDPGVYFVQFTGTFNSRAIGFPFLRAIFDVGFLIGGKQAFINTDSVDQARFNKYSIVYIQRIIEITEKSRTLEVIAKQNTPLEDQRVGLAYRDLSITKIR